MTQVILVPNVISINAPLLDQQLKAAAPVDCYGLKKDKNGVFLVVSESIGGPLLQTLLTIAQTHDPAQKTQDQIDEEVGKVDLSAWQGAVNTALTNIATKRAALVGTQNVANAAALLLELSDDVVLALKALKYIGRRLS